MARRRSILGIDLGTREAKAVEVTLDRGAAQITGFARVQISAGEERRGALAEILRRGRFRARRAVVSVSGKNVYVRYIQVPKMSDEDLRRAVPYEADKYLPFESGKMVLDFQRQGDAGPDGVRVLLVAAPRGAIDEVAHLLEEAGLVLDVVDVDPFAIGNAFERYRSAGGEAPPKEAVVALVDVGASKAVINIVRDGSSYFTRDVGTAGDAFTEAVAKRLGVPPAEAEDLKRRPEGREAEVSAAVQPALDEMSGEVRLSLDYYENQFDRKVDAVCLSGGSSLMAGLPETIGRSCGRPVARWDPARAFHVAPGADRAGLDRSGPHLAVAIGLACRVDDPKGRTG